MKEHEILDLAARLEISTQLNHPQIVAANKALSDHQNRCGVCDQIRQWIAAEFAAGRVRTIEDRNRIGVHIILWACPVGLPLFTEVGKVMMVHPDQSHR